MDTSGAVTSTVYVASMEIELHGATEDHRTVYYAAGGAFRVIGGGGAGLYFRLTDHLGSTSLVIDASGVEKANSRVVYAPFGEVRSGQQSTLTDFGYTGQRHDDTDGLMYYGARYYLPGIQNFITADTITSGASTSQSLNRYAYVHGNPIKYSDPSGHTECITDAGSDGCYTLSEWTRDYGVKWKGGWGNSDKLVVLTAAEVAANALKQVDTNNTGSNNCISCGRSSGQVWKANFGNVTMDKKSEDGCEKIVDNKCTNPFGAKTDGPNNAILFHNQSFSPHYGLGFHYQLPLHEFGHLFAYHAADERGVQAPYKDLANTDVKMMVSDPVTQTDVLTTIFGGEIRTSYGYQDGRPGTTYPYQEHPDTSGGEDFADMFLNWADNSFAQDSNGLERYKWMDSNMAMWIHDAAY